MSFRAFTLAACSAALALAATPALAQQFPDETPRPQQGDVKVGSLQRYKVRGDVYMYAGATGNTLVFIGADCVLVVDPQGGAAAADLMADIKTLSPKPIRWVINTSADADRVAGNQVVAQAGASFEGEYVRGAGGAATNRAKIYAHEGVTLQLSAAGGDSAGWPTDTYFVSTRDMYLNDEGVQMMHLPAAHTGGDSIVVFRRSDVVAVGGVYTPGRFPKIDVANGGSIQGLLNGLNQLLRITIPALKQQGGTLIVPASGRIADEGDVAEYRDMMTIIRDRVRDMIGKRMTLAQIQAAKPTVDYDPVYDGEAAGRALVESIYRSLTAGQTQGRR